MFTDMALRIRSLGRRSARQNQRPPGLKRRPNLALRVWRIPAGAWTGRIDFETEALRFFATVVVAATPLVALAKRLFLRQRRLRIGHCEDCGNGED